MLGFAAIGIIAGGAAVGLGWLAAIFHSGSHPGPIHRNDRALAPNESAYGTWPQMEVTGASMAPTLLGRHVRAACPACGISWPAFTQFSQRQLEAATCWNCGANVPLSGMEVRPGTQVQLIPSSSKLELAAGDLVAVDWPQSEFADTETSIRASHQSRNRAATPSLLSVKRIAALPGQVVTHRNGRLLVDGEPLLADRVWLPVHDDRYRDAGHSRWKPQLSGSADTIEQTTGGFRLRAAANAGETNPEPASDWLVYHHQSVHHNLQPDRIRDDVPSNVSEIRSLLPVSRLRLTLQIEPSVPCTLEVAFWNEPAINRQRATLSSGLQQLDFTGPPDAFSPGTSDEQHEENRAQPDLSAERPLALRILTGEAHVSQLRIARPVEYRIDLRQAEALTWPIRLQPGEFFLLGDNVPFSRDSRHFGPVAGSRIVGRIELVEYDEPGR